MVNRIRMKANYIGKIRSAILFPGVSDLATRITPIKYAG